MKELISWNNFQKGPIFCVILEKGPKFSLDRHCLAYTLMEEIFVNNNLFTYKFNMLNNRMSYQLWCLFVIYQIPLFYLIAASVIYFVPINQPRWIPYKAKNWIRYVRRAYLRHLKVGQLPRGHPWSSQSGLLLVIYRNFVN